MWMARAALRHQCGDVLWIDPAERGWKELLAIFEIAVGGVPDVEIAARSKLVFGLAVSQVEVDVGPAR